MTLPVVDLSLAASDASGVADQIDRAARDDGFFLVVGHGVPSSLRSDLDAAARAFFALDEATKAEMRKILTEIQTGQFAREWLLECKVGRPMFKALLKRGEEHPIEEVGRQMRAMMPWLKRKKLVDRSKN